MARSRGTAVTRKRKRKANGFTLPVAVIAGMAPLANQARMGWAADGPVGMVKQSTLALLGYHIDTNTWNASWMKVGLLPIFVGGLVHWGAKKFGLNRMIARAGIPVIRI